MSRPDRPASERAPGRDDVVISAVVRHVLQRVHHAVHHSRWCRARMRSRLRFQNARIRKLGRRNEPGQKVAPQGGGAEAFAPLADVSGAKASAGGRLATHVSTAAVRTATQDCPFTVSGVLTPTVSTLATLTSACPGESASGNVAHKPHRSPPSVVVAVPGARRRVDDGPLRPAPGRRDPRDGHRVRPPQSPVTKRPVAHGASNVQICRTGLIAVTFASPLYCRRAPCGRRQHGRQDATRARGPFEEGRHLPGWRRHVRGFALVGAHVRGLAGGARRPIERLAHANLDAASMSGCRAAGGSRIRVRLVGRAVTGSRGLPYRA